MPIRGSPNGAVRPIHTLHSPGEGVDVIARNGWTPSMGIGGRHHSVHILEAVKASRYARPSAAVLRIANEVSELIGRRPNVDFALGFVSVTLKLPPGSGLGMFLVGRCVGWIAHVIEQYAAATLIRPRARYVGVLPV